MTTIRIEDVFQALGDPLRLRIVRLLAATAGEACLCELVDSLVEPKYKLSKALKKLRDTNILSAEKEGRWVYHRLVENSDHLTELFGWIRDMADTKGTYSEDLSRFQLRLGYRENGRCRVSTLSKDIFPMPTAVKRQRKASK